MTARPVCLDAEDVVELCELLECLGDWLASDRDRPAESLRCFLGAGGYDVDELRVDLARFEFLLGVSDGDVVFGGDER